MSAVKDIEKTEKKLGNIEQKTLAALKREYSHLLTIHKLVERFANKEGKKSETPVINTIKAELKRENKDERIFNRTLSKFEKILEKSLEDYPQSQNKLNTLLERIEIFKKQMVASLSKGGELEKIAKSGDIQRLRDEIEKDLKLEQSEGEQIQILWREMDEELKAKQQGDTTKDNTDAINANINKFMNNSNFKFMDFRKFDDNTKFYILNDLFPNSFGIQLSDEEKKITSSTGIFFRFSTDAESIHVEGQMTKFVIFVEKRMGNDLPIRMKGSISKDGPTGQHSEIIGGREDKVLYAGIVEASGKVTPAGHWGSIAKSGYPRDIFGSYIRDLFSQ